MRIVVKIALNELRYLFYSPIAWFVLIVFTFQCALFYTGPVYDMAVWTDILKRFSPDFQGYRGVAGVTFELFITRGDIFLSVFRNLYLFVPILTMGLISRESTNGTLRLLYSSPVRVRQVVFGKYLGIMLYNCLLVGVLGIFLLTGCFNIVHTDYGMLLSAAFGFFLLLGAYSAIGLFMSSLSTYQVVSALGTFAIVFVLTRIGDLWQRYDFVRDLTYFLSLQSRTLKMVCGLIVSRDVLYFLIVSALFVGFTLIRLGSERQAKPWYMKVLRYGSLMLPVLLVGYVTSRPILTGYWDTTATQFNTVPEKMQNIIKEFGDSTLEVTLYANLLDNKSLIPGLPETRNAGYLSTGMWEPYQRFKPDMHFSYRYYYDTDAEGTDSALFKANPGKTLDQIAALSADAIDYDLSMFESPAQLHKTIDLRPEGYRLVMQLKYKGRVEFLRTFDDNIFWPQLPNVSAAFKRLLHPATIPKIYFVVGDWERSIYKTGEREYNRHTASKPSRGALINTGFDVDTLNLSTTAIPAGTTALVLADPKSDLRPIARDRLKAYIGKGGNMLIMGMPPKQSVLNPLLGQLGVQLMSGQLVEPTYNETPDKVIPYATAAFGDLYEGLSGVKKALETGKDTVKILMPEATGLTYDSNGVFRVTPLVATVPGRTWLKAGDLVADSTLPPFNPVAGDLKEPSFPTVLRLTRQIDGKQQRIIVCGNADFASNKRLQTGVPFLMPLYSWLSYNEFPVYLPRPEPKDIWLNISAKGAGVQKAVLVWGLPGLLLLCGTILLIRRKRK